MTALALFASLGPFNPSGLECLLLVIALVDPFALLLLAARSLFTARPLPRWLLAVATVGGAWAGYSLVRHGIYPDDPGVIMAWQLAVVAAAALTPAIVVREAGKRGWLRRSR
jgi:hypothetical protein